MPSNAKARRRAGLPALQPRQEPSPSFLAACAAWDAAQVARALTMAERQAHAAEIDAALRQRLTNAMIVHGEA